MSPNPVLAMGPGDWGELAKITGLSELAVSRLHKRFLLLDRSFDGTLEPEDLKGFFADFPAVMPLVDHGFPARGGIQFEDFLRVMAKFDAANQGPEEDDLRLKFFFDLIDKCSKEDASNADGKLSEEEVRKFISVFNPEMDDDTLDAETKQVMEEMDPEKKGFIDHATFDTFMKSKIKDLEQLLAIDLETPHAKLPDWHNQLLEEGR